MNILSLVESQIEKDKLTSINEGLSDYKLCARKHLELQVKLSYLADETKCYNYKKIEITDLKENVIFERYIDFLSHVLSFGLFKNYFDNYEVDFLPNDYCLSDQFLNLYIDINDLIVSSSKDHLFTLLEDIFSLGVTLGYSEDQIKNSFIF